MNPRDGGASRSCARLAGVLLALLAAAVPACGDGAVGPGDAATDGGDGLSDGDAPDGDPADADGGLDEDGGSGAPCELDFDCAEGEACRDGFCAVTSPDGWCPRVFERPLRRRVLDGPMSGPIGRCGPRCLMGAGRLVEDDPSTAVQVIRRRDDAGVTETTYAPEPEHGSEGTPHLALFQEDDGSVLSATYDQWGSLVIERFVDGVIETPAVFSPAELEMPRGYRANVRGRFQRDADELLHLFFSSAQVTTLCFGHVEQSGDTFDLVQAYCLRGADPDLGYFPADAMLRTDGGIDVVAGLGPWNGDPPDQIDAIWLDGWDPGSADPLMLGPGAGPDLCLAPDGSSVLGLDVWIAGPVRPLLDRTDLLWLAGSGTVEQTLSLPLADLPSSESGWPAVLSCDPAETVVLYRGGFNGEPEPLARWRDGAVVEEHDLIEAVEAAGGGWAVRWEQGWYERCGGVRALLVETVAPSVTESSYIEW
ncbi:MAG: hypothetical protein HY905_27575 [Deltaproteobacteria bacterium]|nr:hypothetical protein [Deltaproteobacteria bacterium]